MPRRHDKGRARRTNHHGRIPDASTWRLFCPSFLRKQESRFWTPAFDGVSALGCRGPTKTLGNLEAEPNDSDHVHSMWVSKAN
jgi:hypothetical protein